MTLGYTDPLYLLPFDHRHSYLSGMFPFRAAADRARSASGWSTASG